MKKKWLKVKVDLRLGESDRWKSAIGSGIMQHEPASVTERLLPLVNARHQFTDIRAAWGAFLEYLRARRGADIQGVRGLQEVEAVSRFVDSELLEKTLSGRDSGNEWFRAFEQRDDVLTALEQFLRIRDLIA